MSGELFRRVRGLRRRAGLLVAISLFWGATVRAAGQPAADDFNSITLNSQWTFGNPLNDATYSLNGTNLLLSVPAGSSHDLWTGQNNAVRVMQNVTNGNFLVQAKFDSPVGVSSAQQYQMQGILVEQDGSNFLRFDVLGGGGVVRMFSGRILAGNASAAIDVRITPSYPIWLRVQRTTNTFAFSWSKDGNTFTSVGSYAQTLTVNRVGVYGGNSGSPSQALTTSVDYFLSGSGPDLTITKSHSSSFTQGGTGSYAIATSNLGTASTSGTVTVTDTLPTGLTPTSATGAGWTCGIVAQAATCATTTVLAAGSSYPAITLSVSVAADAPSTVTNTASVSGGGDTNAANNSASDPTTISAALTPDLTISKSHTGNFTQGSTGSYTITASNAGTGATSGTVTVTDTLPTGLTPTSATGTGWACGIVTQTVTCTTSTVLAAGSSYPAITLSVSVAADAPSTVTNTASISGSGDTNAANNSASDPTTIDAASTPDLTITKSHTGNFTQGGTGSYTITASNAGTASTGGTVTVADTLPTGLTPTSATGTGWTCGINTQTVTCTTTTVLAGGSSYPDITLAVSVAANAPSLVTNTASVSGGGDSNSSNNSASDPTTIQGVVTTPDLTITKIHTGNFTQGGTGSYTITASNAGTGATSGTVTVTDTAPTGLTPTSATGTGWTCGIATQTVTCTNGTVLAAGSSYPAITLAVSVAANAPATVTNIASVSGGGDTNVANNSASDPTTINGTPDLTITKSHTGNFTQGGTGSYTITASNAGTASTSGTLTVTDTVPTGLTPTSATGTGWTCGIVTQTVTCTNGTVLAAGSSYPAITLAVSVAANAPATVTNTASVSGGGDTNAANNSASDPTTIAGTPDLTITKTHTGNFTQGGTGSYTITASNAGTASTSGTVTVADTLPTGLTPTSATGTGWTCGIATQTVTCTNTTVLAGGSGYPAITLAVSVAANAPATVTNTAAVSGGGDTNAANNSASDPTTITGTTSGPPVPDDFNSTTLNSQWTFVNPLNDANYSLNGTNLVLSVPAGSSHDLWSGQENAVRVTQDVANGNFLVQAKFDSPLAVSSAQQYQMQGILVEQDGSNFLRFDVLAGGGVVRMFSAKIIGGSASALIDVGITPSYPIWLRVQRTTNTFAFSWSTNGTTFTSVGSYTQNLTVNRVGLYGGNSGSPSQALTTSVDYFLSGSGSDLTITKSHTGNFTQGASGSYTITARNAGTGPTSGTVTVTDTVPAGLTPTSAAGTGWTCGIATQTVTCTNTTVLAANASYPAITLSVSVAANAPATVTNTASVSGGGDSNAANNAASDPTTIAAAAPDLTITKSHSGNFTQGGTGSYTITASNGGAASTSGTVTVTDTLPAGLTPTSAAGTGWTCGIATQTVTCTNGTVRAAGSAYPGITLAVSVAANAPATVTNSATVSGGGDSNAANNTASDPTTIVSASAPDLTITKSHTGNFTKGGTGSYTVTASNVGTGSTSGTVTVTDTLPTGLTPTSATGTGWTCGIASQTVTCTRATVLAGGSSYPAITLAVSVAANAPATVTNTASISGVGDTNAANNSASDPTTILGGAFVSDDFHSVSLNTALWTFTNPLGDGSFRMTGSNILIFVPGGSAHSPWGVNNAVRILQAASNADFQVEASFQSVVSQSSQIQGILIEQDANNYLRFEVNNTGAGATAFSGAIINGTPTGKLSGSVTSGVPIRIRVTRSGVNWTMAWSTDGTTYTTVGSYSQTLTVNRVGPFAGNDAAPPSSTVDFTASVDYFFNTASPIVPEDGGGPGITVIAASAASTGATITWTTDRPTTSQVKYGLSVPYSSSSILDSTLVTGHSVSLTGLTCGSTYHYSALSQDSAGNIQSPDATFVPPCSGAPASDDFTSTTLNASVWTFVNPLNDGSFTLNGSTLSLTVPSGSSHDVWTTGNQAVRVMQTIANADFEVEAKFNSALDKTAPYQEQGIVVEQDSSHFIRFSVYSDNLRIILFGATISGSSANIWLNQQIRGGPGMLMRVKRTGNAWQFSYSYDSLHWTPAYSFNQAFQVARIGPYAANGQFNAGLAPAFTAVVDHFINRTSPPASVDGSPYPPSPVVPSINVWYGDTQTFGQNGIPQQWVNILGDVTGFDQVNTLTYTLNGGSPQTLWIGENMFRLVAPGEYNVEIDYASLNPGSNTVQITATDTVGRQATHTVTVNYVAGKTWPSNYTVNWSTAGSIQSVAQIVDGQWQLQSNGTVRNQEIGYDRLITIGDRTTWKNYTVSAEVTLNSLDPFGFAVGIVVGWQGHTTVQYGQVLPDQPRTGHPFPGLFEYSSNSGPPNLNIYENTPATPENVMVKDTSGRTLQLGTKYIFKCQVAANTTGGSHYSFKVWPASSTEPANWDLQTDGELSQGSIVLAAHMADVSFGTVTVTGQ